MGKSRLSKRGFTLVEILLYTAILAITAGLLTAVLSNTLRIRNKEANSTELAQQLGFVMENVQNIVSASALIEDVYETGSPGTACTAYCTVKLRTTATSTDPTFIHADASGTGIYLTQGEASPNTNNPLTGSDVTVDHFILTKLVFEGGHDSLRIDMALTIDPDNPQLAVTRSIQSAVGRATAATFDDHLLPNTDNSFDIGQVSGSSRWRDGAFSRNLTVQSSLAIGGTTASRPLSIQESVNDWVEFRDSAGTVQWHFAETNAGDFDIAESGIANGRLYLKAGGNVGIGTTGPLTRLDVRYGKAGLNDAAILVDSSNCGSPCAQEDWNEGLRVMNSNTNGRIGIGFLVESSFTINTVPSAWIGTINNSGNGSARTFVIATNPAGSLVEQFRIDGDDGDLRVQNDIFAEGRLVPKSAGGGEYIANGQDTGVGDWGLDFYTGNASRLYIKNNGNIGIGTTSGAAYKLHVIGDIYANGGWFRVSDNNGFYFQTHGGGWYMTDSTWIRSYNGKQVLVEGSGDGLIRARSTTATYRAVFSGMNSAGSQTSYISNTGDHWSATGSFSSSLKVKEDIKPFADVDSIDLVRKLEPYSYKRVDDGDDSEYIGFIAEYVPERARSPERVEKLAGYPSVNSLSLVTAAIGGVRYLDNEVNSLQTLVNQQSAQITLLAQKLEEVTGEKIDLGSVTPSESSPTSSRTENLMGAGLLGGLSAAAVSLLLLKRKP